MRGWSFTIITIILLILKDLFVNFASTCTLKDRRIARLCLFKGNLTSLHD
jgi:hypothetical protein